MNTYSVLRPLVLAAMLSAPLVQVAFADQQLDAAACLNGVTTSLCAGNPMSQQQSYVNDANASTLRQPFNGGPYTNSYLLSPPVGD